MKQPEPNHGAQGFGNSDLAFRAFFDNARDAMLLLDGQVFVDCNPALLELFDCKREEIVNMPPDCISPQWQPDGRSSDEKSAEMIAHTLENGSHLFEWTHRTPNGKELPVEVSLTLIPYQNRQALLGVLRSLSERNQALAKLRDSEEQYRTLFESQQDGMFVAQSEKLALVNQALAGMLGYSPKEMVGTPFSQYIAPEDLPLVVENYRRRVSGEPVPDEYPCNLLHKDGQTRLLVNLRATAVQYQGKPASLGTIRNVTEKMQMERALFESQAQLQTVVHSTPIMLYALDKNGVYTLLEGKGLADVGLVPGQFVGQSVFDIYKDVPPALEDFRRALAGEQVHSISEVNGIVFETTYSPMFDGHGQQNGTIGISFNITDRIQAQRDAQEAAQQIRTVFETITDGIVVLDNNARIIDVNEAAIRMHGYDSRDELVGLSPMDLIVEEEREQARQEMRAFMEAGSFRMLEQRAMRRDGKIINIEMSISMLKDAVGNHNGFIAVLRDVSGRKQAEEALRHSEEQYRILFNNQQNGVFVIQDGKMLVVNQAFADMVGYTPAELTGMPFQQLVAPEDMEVVLEDYRRRRMGDVTEAENMFRMLHKDGQTRVMVNMSASTIRYQDQLATLGAIQNVTEKMLAEAEHNRLLAILENTNDFVGTTDMQANLLYMNAAGRQMLGIGLDENIRQYKMPDLSPAWANALVFEEVLPIVTERGIWVGESGLLSKTGQEIPILQTIMAHRGPDGEVQYLSSIARDISERKKFEQQLHDVVIRRGYQVQVSTQIAQEIAAAPAQDELFRRVVTLVKERLGYYHAQLLRYEPGLNSVVLVSGYGEIGEKMQAEGHRMDMGRGLIGVAAATGQTVLRSNVTRDADWRPNPLLPDTRGEIAVPIKFGDRILGVLDVQSNQADALTEEDQQLLEGLCGQIAIAIEGARLRMEMEERLNELNALYRTTSREGWQSFTHSAEMGKEYIFDRVEVRPTDNLWVNGMVQAVQENRLVVAAEEQPVAVSPLSVRGEVIGALGIYDDPKHPLSQEELALVEQISDQVALALESARLFEQTRVALNESEHQAHNLVLLNQMGEALNKAENVYEVLNVVFKHTSELLNIDIIGAALTDPDGESFMVYASLGGEEPQVQKRHWPMKGTLVGRCIRENRVLLTPNDVSPEAYSDTRLLLSRGINATMSVPLAINNQVIGTINIGMTTGLFDDQDRNLMLQVASLLSSSLTNRRLFEQIQRTLIETEKMYSFSRRLTVATDLHEILGVVAETASISAINRSLLVTFEYNDQKSLSGAQVRANWFNGQGLPPTEVGTRYELNMVQRLFTGFLSPEPIYVEQTSEASHARGVYAIAGLPLWSGNQQMGVVLLECGEEHAFTEDEKRPLGSLAQQAAIAIQTRLLFEQVASSEARFRDISISSADWVWEVDSQGKFTYASDRIKDVLGYAPVELLGTTPFDLMVPEDIDTAGQRFMEMVLKHETITDLETRNRTKDGQVRIMLNSGMPVLDEKGNLLGYRGVARDITERKKAEAVLEDQRRTLQAVLDNMAAGVFMVEAPSGRPILSNKRAEEFLGRGISPTATGDDLNQFYQAYRYGTDEFYPTEEMPVVAGMFGQSKTIDDMEVRRPDGSKLLLQITGSPVYDSAKNIVASVVVFQNITEQRKAQETIRKRAAELATVSEVATAVSTILSPDEMLQTVVDMTRSSFDLYHAHIYLLNEAGDTLVLAKGAGEIGRRMVAEGRQIALTAEKSLVARAARTRQGVIVNKVREDEHFLPHPLLPDTLAEMAVPMLVGDRLLGVLDIQDSINDRFSEEDLLIQSTLAAQVAVALQNARQYEQVQASSQLVRTVIDATPDWIFIKDLDHRYRLVNKGYADALHIAPEAFIGKNDLELGFPEDLVKGNPEKGIRGFWVDDREIFESGEARLFPNDPATIDGEVHVFNTYKTPLRDNSGNIIGVLAFSRDVTEREELLQNMESQQRTLQAVLDNMPAGLFMVEAPSGRPILSNRRAEDFLGRGISPKTVGDGLNEVYQAYRYGTEELYPAGEMPIVAGLMGQAKVIDDMEVRRPDGSRVLLQVNGAPVFDANGSVVASVVVFQDITETHKAAEELRANQAQLAEALSIAKMGYWEFDFDRGVYTFNDQLYKILGVTAEEIGGYEITPQTYVERFVPANADSESVGREIVKALETKDPNYMREMEQPFLRGDGSEGYLAIRFRVVKDATGRTIRLTGTNQDISEQRKAQDMLAKRAVELATVAEVATTVSTFQSPEEMLQTVVDLTKQSFGLYHAHVYLMDEASDSLVLTKGAGQVGRQMVAEGRRIGISTEKSLVARAARVRQGVIANDVRQDPDFLPHPLLPSTRSELAVPMVVGDSVLGVIDIQDEQVGRFTQEDVNIMTTLAAQVAVSLQNARSYARAQRQAEREALINAISERIQSTSTVESALQVAVRELGRALGARRTAVQLGLEEKDKKEL